MAGAGMPAMNTKSRREMYQVAQAARRTIDATTHLPSPTSLAQTAVAQALAASGEKRAKATAAVSQAVYTPYDLGLVAEILRAAENSATQEQQAGKGSGEVCSLVSPGSAALWATHVLWLPCATEWNCKVSPDEFSI